MVRVRLLLLESWLSTALFSAILCSNDYKAIVCYQESLIVELLLLSKVVKTNFVGPIGSRLILDYFYLFVPFFYLL